MLARRVDEPRRALRQGAPLRRGARFLAGAAVLLAAPSIRAQPPPGAPLPADHADPSFAGAPSEPAPAVPAPAPAAAPAPRAASPIAPVRVTPAAAAPAAREAPEGARLRWDEAWPRVTLLETAAAAVLGLGAFAAKGLPQGQTGRWQNGFDEGIRDALRAESRGTRDGMAAASDGMFYGLMIYPVIVDTLLVAGSDSTDVAWQMMVMNLQSLALSGFTAIALERVAGRERPYARHCAREPGYHPNCTLVRPDQNASFPSGHILMSATGAGLVCAHHAHLPLYGGCLPDVLACGTALAILGAESVLRLTADAHYTTDLIGSNAIGLAAGYMLPKLLHYRSARGGGHAAIVPYASGDGAGLAGVGAF